MNTWELPAFFLRKVSTYITKIDRKNEVMAVMSSGIGEYAWSRSMIRAASSLEE